MTSSGGCETLRAVMNETAVDQAPARTTFVTTADQLEAIEELARVHQRSVSGEIRMALALWIDHCDREAQRP